ncbi:hypothetical protein CDD80_1758 [Ophiocordyceps camponoti-rufipedis]|uniref:Apple domain-containing protein n=1 Tax=Ophiocordyceps camponoti-rufipedis TaxID=2004952 RepID=A0A2C5Z9S7_9HYPO|nr:hypothetical protein CDD80_1758 [Ophiocordyceps camponoti-rufipedis]
MAAIKTLSWSLAAVLLNSPLLTKAEKVEARPLGKDVTIKGNAVSWISPGGFEDGFQCRNSRILCISDDKTMAACCEEKNKLKGSLESGFYCCAEGHDLAGSKEVGYSCCPTGQQFDGKVCKLVCTNGKVLVDGKCACPVGLEEAAEGGCIKPKCTSGLMTGKCYMFKGESGRRLAYKNKQYSEAIPSKDTIPGKFQLCRDEKCTPNLPINPSQEIHIRDVHGSPPDSADANQWLNNASGGNHMGKTAKYAESGNFTITKWPCGKYCLSGLQTGLGPACPSEDPSITFYRTLSEACVEFELLEVPCKIRDSKNNCIWKGSQKCCGKEVCLAEDETPEPSTQPSSSPSSSSSPSTATEAAPPSETKPPNAQLCPDKHGMTLEANGIGFRVLCGWYYAAKDKLDELKNVRDPLTCHAKCAADSKCQGANFNWASFFCTHQIDWAAEMKDGGNVTGCVTFHPTKPRPI